jgi:hypothetical protein
MAHPHPHPEQLDPLVDERPAGVLRRRLLIAVALASIVVLAAVMLTWQAMARGGDAERAAAAASRACRQVEGLGQKCAADEPEEEAAAPQAVVPSAPASVGPLPGAPHATAAAADESAAQAGMPGAAPGGELTNPGDERIVGLTVRGGRLEVTYADGTVVDAGAIRGAPPAIVLIVPSPAADGRGPNGAVSTPSASPPPSAPDGADAPDPTDTGPIQDPGIPQESPPATYYVP